jgi:hypothetical protein
MGMSLCTLSSICVTLLCIEVGRLFVLVSSDKVMCCVCIMRVCEFSI